MKKHLLILTILWLTLTIGHGQTNVYHPFPDSNAVWRVNSLTGCPVGYNISAPSYYQYTMGGDTTIGAYNYTKIFRTGMFGYCYGDDSTYFVYENLYQGGLRQDTINKKVYFKCHNQPDTLLYDFNLQVGDTFQLFSCDFGVVYPFKVVVAVIDSALVGNSYHKQFRFISSEYFPTITNSIIEGVGATSGLLEPIFDMDPMNSWNLFCFSHGTDNYPSTSTSCPLITGIELSSHISNQLKVFPNPFSSQTTLQTDKVFKDANLTVYNLFGQTVKQKNNLSGQTIIFHRDNLPSGLYLFRLTQDNKIILTDKLIITDN